MGGLALTAYQRYRMLWGGIDWQFGSQNPYSNAQTADGGADARGPNPKVGLRKAVLYFDRSSKVPALDDSQCHFTFLNLTGGSPDDTWITSDYTTLEGYLQAFWTTIKPYSRADTKLREIRWYRVGPGVVAPNPAERTLSGINVAGTGVTIANPQQCACSLTFRTAVRKSWGRTYLPMEAMTVATNGRIGSATVDTVAGAANTLVAAAAGADFYLGVYSPRLGGFLNAEQVEVDDIPDVIRRRRPKTLNYRKILP